jgi:serine/threonine protein kinase
MKPETFGPYTLLRKIATGGTAEIFLARRHGVDGFARHLAIKRILPHLAEDQNFVQLLSDEARLAAHLHHGHIIQIHEVDQCDGQAFIAMEYLPGTDLGRLARAARKRSRRVLVAHRHAPTRQRLMNALRDLAPQVVGAADAEEIARRSAEGTLDLAVVEPELMEGARDRLQAAHPELLRTLVLGTGAGRGHGIYTLPAGEVHPENVRALAEGCLRPAMPLELAVQLVRAVADGLDYAHTATDFDGRPLNIVHRDVNPSNVLVSVSGMVKLVDFGIARAATSRGGAAQRGNLVGTWRYMSPEQTGGKSADARSDLFSLGVLMHELACGEHPFEGDDQFATMRAIREEEPPRVDERVPGLPRAVADIVRRATRKPVDQRYPRADELLGDVEDFVRREGLNLSPKRMAGFMEVCFGKRGVAEFGVSGTGYEVVRPAPTPAPRARPMPTPPPQPPHLVPHEVEVDLDDLDDAPARRAPTPLPEAVDDVDDVRSLGRPHPVEQAAVDDVDGGELASYRRSDGTLRVILTLLIVALVAVAGWYLHWRSSNAQPERSAAEPPSAGAG